MCHVTIKTWEGLSSHPRVTKQTRVFWWKILNVFESFYLKIFPTIGELFEVLVSLYSKLYSTILKNWWAWGIIEFIFETLSNHGWKLKSSWGIWEFLFKNFSNQGVQISVRNLSVCMFKKLYNHSGQLRVFQPCLGISH